MHQTLHLHVEAEMGTAALNNQDLAVLIVDRDGEMRFANTSAEAILRRGDGLTMVRGRLTATSAEMALSGLLAGAVERHHGGAMAVSRPFGHQPYHVLVAPLAPQSALVGAWQRPLVLISDPERRTPLSADLLAQLFRFTAAESRLAMALLAGAEPAEYATANGVSLATVRTQLRALLAKTGTRRQAELVRLLGGVPGLGGSA
jgi:DNA-binding CsgD family transcriptional regulator